MGISIDIKEASVNPEYLGHLDYLDTKRFRGWAAEFVKKKSHITISKKKYKTKIHSSILFIERESGEIIKISPNCERDDLVGHGIPRSSGFDVLIEPALRIGEKIRIKTPDGSDITGSPRIITREGDDPSPEGDYPKAVMISPLTQCNLNCIHCISKSTRKSVSELGIEHWNEIECAIKSGDIARISCDYSGDILYTSKRKSDWLNNFINTGADLVIATHANNLDCRKTDELVRSNLKSINFSLDSMEAQSYARIRKGSKPLSEVLRNIKNFMKKKNLEGKKFKTIVSFSLLNSSVLTLMSSIHFAKKYSIDIVEIHHVMVFTDDIMQESLMPRPYFYKAVYNILTKYAQRMNVNLSMPHPVLNSNPEYGHQYCTSPWTGVFILGNGDVLACCMPGTVMGNLRKSSLSEIWKSRRFSEFRSQVNNSPSEDPCKTCPIYRKKQNFKSYVPGLSETGKNNFEKYCMNNIWQYESDHFIIQYLKYSAVHVYVYVVMRLYHAKYLWKNSEHSNC